MSCCSSPSSTFPAQQEQVDALRKPLLGDEVDPDPEQERSGFEDGDYDEEDETSSSSSPTALESWCDSLLAWFVLPCLLWLDFWLVLHNNSHNIDNGDAYDGASSLPSNAPAVTMASVHFSFLMFIVATFMYRKTLEENQFESVLLLLVPEIAMNAMLLLIFVNQTLAAYLLLLAVILGLSVVVVVVSAIRLGCVYEVPAASRGCLLGDEEEVEPDVEGGTLAVVVPSVQR